MSFTRLSLLALPVAIAAAGCGKVPDDRAVTSSANGETSKVADSTADDRAMVRVVHAIPGAESVDVRAGDAASFSGVGFKTVTAYQPVADNNPKLTIVDPSQPTAKPLAENTEIVMDGRYYTVVAFPKTDGTGAEVEALRDDLTPSDSTKARIRIINAAVKSADVDVILETSKDPLFEDVGFKDDAGFKEVPAGPATLIVMAADSRKVLLRMPGLDLRPGQSVTLVLTHPTSTSSKLDAIQVIDQVTGSGS